MYRIIIAGADKRIAQQLETYLQFGDCDVVGIASSGNEMIKMAQDLKPDLACLDVDLPGKITGIDAAEKIKKKELDIAIIFIASFMDEELIQRAKQTDPFGYILKPLQEWQVKATIEIAHYKKDIEQKLRQSANDLNAQVQACKREIDVINKRHEMEAWTRKEALRVIEYQNMELEEKSRNLEEVNKALQTLLDKRDQDREDLKDRLMLDVRELILPYIAKLKESDISEKQRMYIEIIEANLDHATTSIVNGMSDIFLSLTPTELKVVNLLRQGRATKQIAELLGVSLRTVEAYRDSIRKKLGIKHKKINLRTFLLSKR